MPPTYSPLWKPFEILARLGLPRATPSEGVVLGSVAAVDALGGDEWKRHAASEALYDLWGPARTSVWSGYHKPTLFAALDGIGETGRWPRATPGLDAASAPHVRPRWADERTAIALDLPGDVSVAYAAWLCMRAGHAPVATFNHWPHAAAVVDATRVLGALLHYGPWMRLGELHMVDERRAPPVLMLDRARFGGRPPRPTDFDNRYFLSVSDLPSGQTLANAGIERLVYVGPTRAAEDASPLEMDDLNGWLFDLQERAQVWSAHASLDGWGITEPQRYAPAVRKTPFNTTSLAFLLGFRRNPAGGFGGVIPEPSSGGS